VQRLGAELQQLGGHQWPPVVVVVVVVAVSLVVCEVLSTAAAAAAAAVVRPGGMAEWWGILLARFSLLMEFVRWQQMVVLQAILPNMADTVTC
jgi:hypothetical protein